MATPKRTAEGVRTGRVLREIRHEHGLTQKAVAERFGLGVEGYRQYERGYVTLKRGAIAGMAAALGVPTDVLAGRLEMSRSDHLFAASVLDHAGPESVRPARPGTERRGGSADPYDQIAGGEAPAGPEEILPGLEMPVVLAHRREPVLRLRGVIRSIRAGRRDLALSADEWASLGLGDGSDGAG